MTGATETLQGRMAFQVLVFSTDLGGRLQDSNKRGNIRQRRLAIAVEVWSAKALVTLQNIEKRQMEEAEDRRGGKYNEIPWGSGLRRVQGEKRDGDCWKEQNKDGILKRERPQFCTGTKMEFLVKRNRQAYYLGVPEIKI